MLKSGKNDLVFTSDRSNPKHLLRPVISMRCTEERRDVVKKAHFTEEHKVSVERIFSTR